MLGRSRTDCLSRFRRALYQMSYEHLCGPGRGRACTLRQAQGRLLRLKRPLPPIVLQTQVGTVDSNHHLSALEVDDSAGWPTCP